MGRSLGYFDSDELDRPELNKCPECECFFASEECPLCGKVCPEDFRAGNRAPVKKKKHKNSSGRVQFIPWYHTWWFILIMMFVMPVVGIILFFTSPYSKGWKIAGVVVGLLYFVFVYMGVGWMLIDMMLSEDLVNDDISREEYVQLCESMNAEDYCRDAYNEGNYVTLELVVEAKTEVEGYAFYLCTDRTDRDSRWEILVMDCSVYRKTNYIHGDVLRVYGECSGIAEGKMKQVDAYTDAPLLYMAYSELVE